VRDDLRVGAGALRADAAIDANDAHEAGRIRLKVGGEHGIALRILRHR